MTKLKILGAAAMLSLTFATPVFAQEAIRDPGAFAFYHPDDDVLSGGRPTAATGLDDRTLMQLDNRDAYGTPVNRRHETFQR